MIDSFKKTVGAVFGFMFTVIVTFVVVGSIFKFFDEGSRHRTKIAQISAHPASFYDFDTVYRADR